MAKLGPKEIIKVAELLSNKIRVSMCCPQYACITQKVTRNWTNASEALN